MPAALDAIANDVAALARERRAQIVLAESCTAGLVANSLSLIPGASEWFCGSMVVYQNTTKTAWLQIAADQLANPAIGPVSESTAQAMCQGVLQLTPQASLAASVTGHLGPNAPKALDGLIYIGLQTRSSSSPHPQDVPSCEEPQARPYRLANRLPADSHCNNLRQSRQIEAARLVLTTLRDFLQTGEMPAIQPLRH